MHVTAMWCCACGTLRYEVPGGRGPAQMHRPQRHTCESQYRDHTWLRVGLVDVRHVPDVDSVDVLRGAGGGSPPVEARSAGSERPDVPRHPHPLVTTAVLPSRALPPPSMPSSARGAGTPGNVAACKVCLGYGTVPTHLRLPGEAPCQACAGTGVEQGS